MKVAVVENFGTHNFKAVPASLPIGHFDEAVECLGVGVGDLFVSIEVAKNLIFPGNDWLEIFKSGLLSQNGP